MEIRTVAWTPKASEEYYNNIQYLLDKWTPTDAQNFIDKVEDILSIIVRKPLTFQKTEYKQIHYVPIVPQITLYYRVHKDKVELLRFYPNKSKGTDRPD